MTQRPVKAGSGVHPGATFLAVPLPPPCSFFKADTIEAALICARLLRRCPSLLSWRPAYRESILLACTLGPKSRGSMP